MIVFLLMSMGKATVASAQMWTSNGPEGGEIFALAIEPASNSTIYAGTAGGGVYKSTNAGQSWNATGLRNTSVHALAAPGPTALYAGTACEGVSKSNDGGVTWSAANTGLTGACVNALVVPNQNTLYAATNLGVFRSLNGGGSWSAINNGLTNLSVHTLVIDQNTGHFYAGTDDGVFKSTGGNNWSASGLTSVFSLAFDPTRTLTTPDGILYAGTSGGVFISTDGGASWSATSGTTGTVNALVIDTGSHTLYAGASNGAGVGNVFQSSNGGANWTGTGLSGTNVAALVMDPLTPSTVYAGTFFGRGLFKTTNAGGTWALVNTGLIATRVSALAVDRQAGPGTVFAATLGGGVFKSIDRGSTWSVLNTGLTDTLVFALAIDPTTPTKLYAGTFSGVFKSIDGGASWGATGLTNIDVHALAIDNTNPNTLYAGTFSGVLKSTDGGANWGATSLTNTSVDALAAGISGHDPLTNIHDVFAGTSSGAFKSADGGGLWSATSLTNTHVLGLSIQPSEIVYAGTETGAFKSTPGGAFWSPINNGLTNLRVDALAINDTNPNILYAATDSGVCMSTNGGDNWIAINGGLTITRIFALAIDTRTPTALFAGSDGGGVFVASEPAVMNFSQSAYIVNEGDGAATIDVVRTGNTTSSATIDYATADGSASQRTRYTIASGTLSFAPGETTKSFKVLVTDDVYVEAPQTVNITLSNATGGLTGTPTAVTLTINDNDSSPPTTNPLDNADARFFVRQQYYDFLNRLPDQAGFDFWVGQITQCGSDQTCIRNKRIGVSNAFFFEQEFQQTGAYVYRLYRAAFGNNQPFPNHDNSNTTEAQKIPAYTVFLPDRARVIGGVSLPQAQLDLANLFVQRPSFLAKYAGNLDGSSFIDAVLATIKDDMGVDLTGQKPGLLTLFNCGGRGAVIYRLADDNATTNPINNRAFIDAEYNRAFVTTQYFGYLRRDADIRGFLFWLTQVNGGALRDVAKQHAMVCSFITSAEYQQRFSSVVTHSNAECEQ